jgi:hypothetical protein
MTQQEREVITDSTLYIVEVGVADPARRYIDHDLTGSRVGYDDRLDTHRAVGFTDHDSSDFMRHGAPP